MSGWASVPEPVLASCVSFTTDQEFLTLWRLVCKPWSESRVFFMRNSLYARNLNEAELMSLLRGFKDPHEVVLDCCSITNFLWVPLILNSLTVKFRETLDTNLNDVLPRLTLLQALKLSKCGALMNFWQSSSLLSLTLEWVIIFDDCLDALSDLENLVELRFHFCTFHKREHFHPLINLRNLKALAMVGSGVSDKTFEILVELRSLTFLDLSHSRCITDESLRFAACLPLLEHLHFATGLHEPRSARSSRRT
jgi:hypothetical protein